MVSFHSLHPHGDAGELVEPLRKRRHLVIMRGEQRARTVRLVQMLDGRPGDGEPVEGRRAAADLVQDDEASFRRLVEDRRRLDHLDHEGRTSARQIVGGAHAAEQPIDDADMRAFRRNEASHLRQDGDQRVLAQERRFAGHVGTGDEPQPFAAVAREIAIVGHERARMRLKQCRFHHRMPSAHDLERQAFIDERPRITLVDGKVRERQRHVETRQGARDIRQRRAHRHRFGTQRLEQFAFDGQRLFGRFRDAPGERRQFIRREAHGACRWSGDGGRDRAWTTTEVSPHAAGSTR